jgi:type VI secretion system secreted protein Hcp
VKKMLVVGVMLVLVLATGYCWGQERRPQGQKGGDPEGRPPGAQIDAFLQLDGIPGESKDGAHKDNIDVAGFSFSAGLKSPSHASAGGAGAGKVGFQPLEIIKRVDKASPRLLTACATGQRIPRGVLVVRRGERGNEFLKYTLADIVVTGIKQTLHQGGGVREEVDFTYGKVEIVYSASISDGTGAGTVKGGWDLNANKRP